MTEAYLILENVAKKKTETVLTSSLKKLSYVAQSFFIQSASFGIPQSRTRLYVVGVDPAQVHIQKSPAEWSHMLEDGICFA